MHEFSELDNMLAVFFLKALATRSNIILQHYLAPVSLCLYYAVKFGTQYITMDSLI